MLIGSLLGTVVLLGCAWYAWPLLYRAYQVRRLEEACRRSRFLALTYDDGPGERLTGELLDLLRRFGVRATFFALGRRAQDHLEMLDRVVAEGHEVGWHSWDHLNSWKVSPLRGLRDVRRGFEVLRPWLGPDGLFRPPHGKLTVLTWAWLRNRGVRLGWWTVDSGDTSAAHRNADQVLKRVIGGGGVVLMHDFDGSQERAQYVLSLTERLLRTAETQHLTIVPLGRILRKEREGA